MPIDTVQTISLTTRSSTSVRVTWRDRPTAGNLLNVTCRTDDPAPFPALEGWTRLRFPDFNCIEYFRQAQDDEPRSIDIALDPFDPAWLADGPETERARRRHRRLLPVDWQVVAAEYASDSFTRIAGPSTVTPGSSSPGLTGFVHGIGVGEG